MTDRHGDEFGLDPGTGLRRLEAEILRGGATVDPEPVARARLRRLQLDDLFAENQGAFGCEREDRVELFGLARARAGGWPAERTVAVGDTPLDVRSAHAAGARCIALTTGAYGAEDLADAEIVIGALADLPEALASLG